MMLGSILVKGGLDKKDVKIWFLFDSYVIII